MRIVQSFAVATLFSVLAAASAFAADHAVTIKGMKFSPASLSVKAGDTVTFTNEDSMPHTATAKGAFDTGRLSKGQSKTVTISSAGDFPYICTIHTSMKGKVSAK